MKNVCRYGALDQKNLTLQQMASIITVLVSRHGSRSKILAIESLMSLRGGGGGGGGWGYTKNDPELSLIS